MKDVIIAYLKRPFSLGRIKALMFVPLIGAFFIDFSCEVDFTKGIYSFSSEGSNSITLIVICILFCICLILIDFISERRSCKERMMILEIIRDPNTSDQVREKLMDQYNKKN